MLDRLPTWAQHLVLLLASSVGTSFVAWLTVNQQTILASIPAYLVPLAVAALGSLVLYITKFTKKYGTGSNDPADPAVAPAVAPSPPA